MNVLGLAYYYHDSSAALVKDGALVAASAEEWESIMDAYADLAAGEVPPEVAESWRRARGF